VVEAMKAIAATGRRAVRGEVASGAFRMPRIWSSKGLIDAARALIDEARKREAEFVRLGLPPTFLADFTSLVDRLEQAMVVRLNSSHNRRRDQAGLVAALVRGLDDIRELDVVVPNVVRGDAARLAQWQRARRIDGQSAARARVGVVPHVVVPPQPSSVDPPAGDSTMPATVDDGQEVTGTLAAGEALPKAS
jgi:hypothetical protein